MKTLQQSNKEIKECIKKRKVIYNIFVNSFKLVQSIIDLIKKEQDYLEKISEESTDKMVTDVNREVIKILYKINVLELEKRKMLNRSMSLGTFSFLIILFWRPRQHT